MGMHQSRDSNRGTWHRFHASSIRFRPLRLFLTLSCVACDILPQKGDTEGVQQQAQWLPSARLVVDTDPQLTIIRFRATPLDSAHGGHHVLLTRFDFNPTTAAGDEYVVNFALDLENIPDLRRPGPYQLGSQVPAFATVSCLCRPLRPDSVRGTFTLTHRGLGQIYGRVDATLFFTAWDDSSRHATYRLRQRIDGMR
jgi:hypothetical protein